MQVAIRSRARGLGCLFCRPVWSLWGSLSSHASWGQLGSQSSWKPSGSWRLTPARSCLTWAGLWVSIVQSDDIIPFVDLPSHLCKCACCWDLPGGVCVTERLVLVLSQVALSA